MDAFDDDEFGRRARGLRLDTLILLRWLAVIGQAPALFVSHFGLGVRLPIFPCLGCIGAFASAVVAVKLGAFDYLAKPANADEIVAALMDERLDSVDNPEHSMSADRVRWEHIQRVYQACERNVTAAARQRGMHRRTLQRMLAKRAPR